MARYSTIGADKINYAGLKASETSKKMKDMYHDKNKDRLKLRKFNFEDKKDD